MISEETVKPASVDALRCRAGHQHQAVTRRSNAARQKDAGQRAGDSTAGAGRQDPDMGEQVMIGSRASATTRPPIRVPSTAGAATTGATGGAWKSSADGAKGGGS